MQSGINYQPGIKQVNWGYTGDILCTNCRNELESSCKLLCECHFTKWVWQTRLTKWSMKIVRQVWQTIMNAVRLRLAASKKVKNCILKQAEKWRIPFRTGFSIVCGIFLFAVCSFVFLLVCLYCADSFSSYISPFGWMKELIHHKKRKKSW